MNKHETRNATRTSRVVNRDSRLYNIERASTIAQRDAMTLTMRDNVIIARNFIDDSSCNDQCDTRDDHDVCDVHVRTHRECQHDLRAWSRHDNTHSFMYAR